MFKTHIVFLEKLFTTYQPRKHYCGIRVEFNQIIVHIWQGGRKLIPSKYEYTFNEFENNLSMLALIRSQIGSVWVGQMLSLMRGKGSSLLDLPENFLLELIKYLSLRDLLNLSSTCKYLNKIYSSDSIWKDIFYKFFQILCEFHDYNEVKKNGEYKKICTKIFKTNHSANIIRGMFEYDDIPIGASSGCIHIKMSAIQMRRFPSSKYQDIDEFKSINFRSGKDCQKTKSGIVFDEKSSSINLIDFENSEPLVNELKKKSINKISWQKDELSFSKDELLRRLNRLKENAIMHRNPEDGIPGDYTKKYALRYKKPTK